MIVAEWALEDNSNDLQPISSQLTMNDKAQISVMIKSNVGVKESIEILFYF